MMLPVLTYPVSKWHICVSKVKIGGAFAVVLDIREKRSFTALDRQKMNEESNEKQKKKKK